MVQGLYQIMIILLKGRPQQTKGMQFFERFHIIKVCKVHGSAFSKI